MQKQQVEGEELEPRNTGNVQLDRLLNEASAMPLAISSEEMLRLIPKANTSAFNHLSNLKWIITGSIILTGIVLYLISPFKKENSEEKNKGSYRQSTENISQNGSQAEDKVAVTIAQKQSNISSNEQKVIQPIKSAISNKNSIYLDGTTTVLLTHDDGVVSIELNKSGVKKIIDSGVIVSQENYSDYRTDIEKAFAQTGIKYNSSNQKSKSKQEELAEAIIRGLHNENLLLDGESYDLSLTNKEAILNGKLLSEESKLRMLTIVAQTTGKTLPNDGKIHIRH